MAKTGKIKKKPTTLHSRAARRAVSPSINLDKSLKPTTRDSPPPKTKATSTPSVLGARPAGISKKTKTKPLKRQQRVRHLKGLERAVDNMDKLEHKVQKSVKKEKKVVERKKGWDEVNVEKKKLGLAGKKNAFEALEDDDEPGGKEWVSDEEMPEVDDGVLLEVQGEVKMVVVPESVPLPVATVEEDELL